MFVCLPAVVVCLGAYLQLLCVCVLTCSCCVFVCLPAVVVCLCAYLQLLCVWALTCSCCAFVCLPAVVVFGCLPAVVVCLPAVNFDHMYKLRAPVGTVEGFDISAFDKAVSLSAHSNSCIHGRIPYSLPWYTECTVDREIFTLKIIHKKIFVVLNFRSLFHPQNFFNN